MGYWSKMGFWVRYGILRQVGVLGQGWGTGQMGYWVKGTESGMLLYLISSSEVGYWSGMGGTV